METSKTEVLKKEVNERIEQLKQLRDEVRVHLHLGGMEMKEQWQKLEPKIHEAEQWGKVVTEASKGALTDLMSRAKQLRDGLFQLRQQHAVSQSAEMSKE